MRQYNSRERAITQNDLSSNYNEYYDYYKRLMTRTLQQQQQERSDMPKGEHKFVSSQVVASYRQEAMRNAKNMLKQAQAREAPTPNPYNASAIAQIQADSNKQQQQQQSVKKKRPLSGTHYRAASSNTENEEINKENILQILQKRAQTQADLRQDEFQKQNPEDRYQRAEDNILQARSRNYLPQKTLLQDEKTIHCTEPAVSKGSEKKTSQVGTQRVEDKNCEDSITSQIRCTCPERTKTESILKDFQHRIESLKAKKKRTQYKYKEIKRINGVALEECEKLRQRCQELAKKQQQQFQSIPDTLQIDNQWQILVNRSVEKEEYLLRLEKEIRGREKDLRYLREESEALEHALEDMKQKVAAQKQYTAQRDRKLEEEEELSKELRWRVQAAENEIKERDLKIERLRGEFLEKDVKIERLEALLTKTTQVAVSSPKVIKNTLISTSEQPLYEAEDLEKCVQEREKIQLMKSEVAKMKEVLLEEERRLVANHQKAMQKGGGEQNEREYQIKDEILKAELRLIDEKEQGLQQTVNEYDVKIERSIARQQNGCKQLPMFNSQSNKQQQSQNLARESFNNLNEAMKRSDKYNNCLQNSSYSSFRSHSTAVPLQSKQVETTLDGDRQMDEIEQEIQEQLVKRKMKMELQFLEEQRLRLDERGDQINM